MEQGLRLKLLAHMLMLFVGMSFGGYNSAYTHIAPSLAPGGTALTQCAVT